MTKSNVHFCGVRAPLRLLSVLVTFGLCLGTISAHAWPTCAFLISTGPEPMFMASRDRLAEELKALRGNRTEFLAHYKAARNFAFQLEIMANFMSGQEENKRVLIKLRDMTKVLEDKLGRFNEVDELLAKVTKEEINLAGGESAKKYFEARLVEELRVLSQWLTDEGWLRKSGKLYEIDGLMSKVKWPTQAEFRAYAIAGEMEFLRELQDEIDNGDYDSDKKSGYSIEEVELKVHKLRRNIRKVSQVMAYTNGLFNLTEDERGLGRKTLEAIKHFRPLLSAKIAETPYAKLPAAYDTKPILVPRALFLAVTSYIEVLGNAKDWAQNIDRLIHAGLKGRVDLDHLDTRLVDRDGTPVPFNQLAKSILKEIKDTQLFANMARAIRDLNE